MEGRKTLKSCLGRRNLFAVGVLLAVLGLVGTANGRTITVDDDGPADFNNIQVAINAADEGDTVIVAEGTYYENIYFNETNITLRSTDPNDSTVVTNTIIDGGGSGSVVTFPYRKNANTELAGFAITGGGSGPDPASYAGGEQVRGVLR